MLYVINRSVSDGRSVALSAVAGLEIGNFFHVVAATAGLSAIIAASQTAFTAVKWIGAGYLVFIGLRTLLRKPAVFSDTSASVTLRRSFTQGIIVNIFNPKVALFFLSFLPQFIDPRISLLTQFVWMALTFVVIEFLYELAVASAANKIKPFLAKFGKKVNRVFGGIFIAIGIALPLRG